MAPSHVCGCYGWPCPLRWDIERAQHYFQKYAHANKETDVPNQKKVASPGVDLTSVGCHFAGQKLMACLKCISKGLEADSGFTRLWLLYLPLYRRHTSTKGDPSDATHVAQSCLSHSKHCYQLWLTAVQLQPDWQRRAILLQRGIVALAQTEPGDYKGVSDEEAEEWAAMRSACVLDLALRLLLLWACVEAHDVVAVWVAELVKLAGQGRSHVQSDDGEFWVA